jgi:uncharacterized protein (DUF1697 family)
MTAFVALLRAVNVGGTGKLPMSDLKEICEELGFAGVRTYIASGNVVFSSRKSEAAVKAALEKRLETYAKKPVGVLVRTAAEMAQVLADNPFPKEAPNRTMAVSSTARRRWTCWPAFAASAANRSGWDVARSTSTMARAWGRRSS